MTEDQDRLPEPSRTPPEGRGAFAALIVAGALILTWRVLHAAQVTRYWGQDALTYLVVARNLWRGEGLSTDLIFVFFDRYPQVAHRPDDFIRPLWPWLIAASAKLCGARWVAFTAIPLVCHAWLFPLAARAVAYQLGASPRAALLTGWTCLLHPLVSSVGGVPLTDLPFAVLTTVALWWYLARDDGLGAVACGALIGLACLMRSVGLWLLLVLPVCHALRRRRWEGLFGREVLLIWLVSLMVQMPWFARSQRLFGSPLYSVQQRLSGFLGRSDWTMPDWQRLWWDREPPSLVDRYATPEAQGLRHLATYLVEGAALVYFDGVGVDLPGKLGPVFRLCLGLVTVPGLWLAWRRRRDWRIQFALLIPASLVLFVCVTFFPGDTRLFVGLYPMVIGLAWAALDEFAARRPGGLGSGWVTGLAATWLTVMGGLGLYLARAPEWYYNHDSPFRWQIEQEVTAAQEAGRRIPDGEVLISDLAGMSAVCWWSDRPTVMVPAAASAADLGQVTQQYNVRHALLSTRPRSRPAGTVEPRQALLAAGWREGWRGADAVLLSAPTGGLKYDDDHPAGVGRDRSTAE